MKFSRHISHFFKINLKNCLNQNTAIDVIFHFIYSLCLYGQPIFEGGENAKNYAMTKRMKRGFSIMAGGSKINKTKLDLEKVYLKISLSNDNVKFPILVCKWGIVPIQLRRILGVLPLVALSSL